LTRAHAASLRVTRPAVVIGSLLVLLLTGQAGLSGLGARLRAPRADVTSYTIQRGDTLTAIAVKFNVSLTALATANRIVNIQRVYAGDTLTIPAPPAPVVAKVSAAAVTTKLPPVLLAHPERMALMSRFDKWAAAYSVPPELLKALTWMESGWQNDAVSSVSARGIGQLTPDTAKFVADQLLRTRLDAAVPDDNIRMSARFLSYLLTATGGDERQALAAYYQGLGSLRKYGILTVSTYYIDDVMALRPMFA
jgi:soluble lytic murein transglycosylase-like protein